MTDPANVTGEPSPAVWFGPALATGGGGTVVKVEEKFAGRALPARSLMAVPPVPPWSRTV